MDFKAPDYERLYAQRAERLHRIRTDPGLVPGLKEHYKAHPIDFINDWGMTVDPRNAEIGLPSIIPFLLFPKQADFVTWVCERWLGREDGLAEKSRDMGISWPCVGIAVSIWTFYLGVVIGFGSRKEEYVDKLGDPKSLFWKVRQFIKPLPSEFRRSATTRRSTRRTYASLIPRQVQPSSARSNMFGKVKRPRHQGKRLSDREIGAAAAVEGSCVSTALPHRSWQTSRIRIVKLVIHSFRLYTRRG